MLPPYCRFPSQTDFRSLVSYVKQVVHHKYMNQIITYTSIKCVGHYIPVEIGWHKLEVCCAVGVNSGRGAGAEYRPDHMLFF